MKNREECHTFEISYYIIPIASKNDDIFMKDSFDR